MKEVNQKIAADVPSPITFMGHIFALGIVLATAVLGLDWILHAIVE